MLSRKLICQIRRMYSKTMTLRPIKVHYPNQSKDDLRVRESVFEEFRAENELIRSQVKQAQTKHLKKDFRSLMIDKILNMSHDAREENGIIILEGKRLVSDALECGLTLHNLLYSDSKHLIDFGSVNPQQQICVTKKELKKWSSLSTCPGLLGIFAKPELLEELDDPNFPVSVICDNVRDPGNMGSLIRCAAAAGCKNILLTKGCVDIWDRKVLRAAAGAHFKLNLKNKLSWDDIDELLRNTPKCFLADIFEHESDLKKSESFDLPGSYYSSVKYQKEKMALVIGGETHGLSNDAKKIENAVTITIPMSNNINSLNSATALGILLFEMKRQLQLSHL